MLFDDNETTPSQAVMDAVRQMRLEEYDWDGVGGLPMRPDVADTIADIYEMPFTDLMPMPNISLNGDGTVDIEYDEFVESDGGKKLFLTFVCQGVVTYVQEFGDPDSTVEGTVRLDAFARTDGTFDPDNLMEITALFEWLAED